jgi:hypothetical protein
LDEQHKELKQVKAYSSEELIVSLSRSLSLRRVFSQNHRNRFQRNSNFLIVCNLFQRLVSDFSVADTSMSHFFSQNYDFQSVKNVS